MRLHPFLVVAVLVAGCEAPPGRLSGDAGGLSPATDGGDSLRITTEALADGEWGVVYSFDLEVAGGEEPYSWGVAGGTLPENAWLQPEGRIVSPALGEEGRFSVIVEVTDMRGLQARRALPFTVLRGLELPVGPLPRAYVGRPYDATIPAVGGEPPRRFELLAGTLPDGLDLDGTGRVTGTPAREGSEALRLRVSDSAGNAAEIETMLSVWGPIAIVDDTVREVRFCFARRLFELRVADLFEVEAVDLAVHVTATDLSRFVVTLISPSGTEVYVRNGTDDQQVPGDLDVVYGAEEPPFEPLDAFVGEPAQGTWTVTLFDPRCPYPMTVREIALVLHDRTGDEDTLRIEGWTASLEAGRPSVRVWGGGIDQSTLALEVVRYSVGPNGIAEGGDGDDVRLGVLPARWTTTLDPAAAVLDEPTGLLTAGAATGMGTLSWEAAGGGGVLPVVVLPPDWVP